jgi:hypothetical protein
MLKHIANEPTDTPRLRDQLRANGHLDTTSLDRSLLRLRRQGIIKLKDSAHVLTPAGRKALNLAISRLKDLVLITRGRP